MAVLFCVVGDDDTGCLEIRGFEVLEETVFVADGGGDAVVSDQWLCEDEDLAAV